MEVGSVRRVNDGFEGVAPDPRHNSRLVVVSLASPQANLASPITHNGEFAGQACDLLDWSSRINPNLGNRARTRKQLDSGREQAYGGPCVMAASKKVTTNTRLTPPASDGSAATVRALDASVIAYNNAQSDVQRAICIRLATLIDQSLRQAESKVWHGGPVWFLDGNPIVGYWVRKQGTQLLFWSGQSFEEQGLVPEGKFKAAEVKFGDVSEIRVTPLKRWLRKAKTIQWDYKNIAKRRGVLEKLGDW
jgi:hypothetical protein